MLKSIIEGIVTEKEKDKKDSTISTPDTPDAEKKEHKQEKWRSLDEEKQKKLYENTVCAIYTLTWYMKLTLHSCSHIYHT